MARFAIDPEQTQLTIGTRPGMAGLGARVVSGRGWIDASLTDDGAVDLAQPVRGQLALVVSDVQVGHQLVRGAVERWLGGADHAEVVVTVDEVRPGEDGRATIVLTAIHGSRRVPLVGTARVRTHDGVIDASGVTLCDPRAFGISLPPLLNLVVHARWRVHAVRDA